MGDRIGDLIFGIIFIVGSIVFALIPILPYVNYRSLEAINYKTEGEITEIFYTRSSNRSVCNLRFKYKVDTYEGQSSTFCKDNLKIGDKISLYYDPEYPDNALVIEDISPVPLYFVSCFSLVIFFAGILFIWKGVFSRR